MREEVGQALLIIRTEAKTEPNGSHQKRDEPASVGWARWSSRYVQLLDPILGPGPNDLVEMPAVHRTGSQCRINAGLHKGTFANFRDRWGSQHERAMLTKALEDGLRDPCPHRWCFTAANAVIQVAM